MRLGKYRYTTKESVNYLIFCKNSNGKYICSIKNSDPGSNNVPQNLTMKYDSHKKAFIGIEQFLKTNSEDSKLLYIGSV